MKATFRPENIPVLQVPSLQEVIWSDLPESVRGRDKWEKLTQANLMVVWRQLALVINSLGMHENEAPWIPKIIERLLDIFGHAWFINNFNFTLHRRDLLRPALPKEYKRIAGENYPPTPEWLFGDDLDLAVDKMAKENKLVEKLFPKQKAKKQHGQGKRTSHNHSRPNSHNHKKKGRKVKKGRRDSLDYVSPLPQEGEKRKTPTHQHPRGEYVL